MAHGQEGFPLQARDKAIAGRWPVPSAIMFIAGVEAALRAMTIVVASWMRCSTASVWSLIAAVTALGLGAQPQAMAQTIDPAAVRAAALAAGLDSLANVPVPAVENLDQFLQPGAKARRAAVRLGKALFWDMQVGSDGQACGSCHFHAFADSRATNQLSPGINNLDPDRQGVFDPTASGSAGGANYTLTEEDFPFHLLEDPEENNFDVRQVLFDTDDVASSQGVFAARFERINRGRSRDKGAAFADGVFNVAGVNVRRVEPRNTPPSSTRCSITRTSGMAAPTTSSTG